MFKNHFLLLSFVFLLAVVAFPATVQATEYTSSCADTCNWNEGSSWTGGSGSDWPDGADDQAILSANDDMVIPVGVSITVGTTTFSTGSNGDNTSLKINGTFEMAENVVPVAYSEIQMGAGSTLDLNGFNVAPTAGPVFYTFAGTSDSRITVESTATRGAFTGGAFPIVATWDYVDVSGLADSYLGRSHTSAYTQHFEHSTFTDMDDFYIEGTATNVNAGFEFNYNDIRDPNGGTGDLQPGVIMGNQAIGTAPRELTYNTWSTDGTTLGTISFTNSKDVTFTDNIIQNYKIFHTDGSDTGIDYMRNMFFNTRGDDEAFFVTGRLESGSDLSENYFYYEGNNHPFGFINANDLTFTDNILEQGAGISDVDVNWILYNNPSSATLNIKNNILLGIGGGILATFTGSSSFATLDISNNTTYVDNQNLTGSGLNYPPLLLTEQTGELSGTVNIYNNLHYDIDLGATTQDPLVDLLTDTADQIDLLNYNNGYPDAPSYTANVNVTAGEGPNDFNVDPRFVDKTRNLADWDDSLGGAGSAANAISEMLKLNGTGGAFDPDYTPSNVITHIQAGFTPQASELDGAGSGGGDVGAVSFTADTTAPVLSGGSPSGEQSRDTTEVTLSLSTDESALCKYGTVANTAYASIANSFSATSTSHSVTISDLTSGNSYTYYVRCQDSLGNTNSSDYTISFSIANSSSGPAGSYIDTSANEESNSNRESLLKRITELQILLKQLRSQQNGTSTNCTFTRNLQLHATGEDVRCLQQYLNTNGFTIAPSGPGSLNNETQYFGNLTYNALVRFQNAHAAEILTPVDLTSGTGYFGPSTRAFINGN